MYLMPWEEMKKPIKIIQELQKLIHKQMKLFIIEVNNIF